MAPPVVRSRYVSCASFNKVEVLHAPWTAVFTFPWLLAGEESRSSSLLPLFPLPSAPLLVPPPSLFARSAPSRNVPFWRVFRSGSVFVSAWTMILCALLYSETWNYIIKQNLELLLGLLMFHNYLSLPLLTYAWPVISSVTKTLSGTDPILTATPIWPTFLPWPSFWRAMTLFARPFLILRFVCVIPSHAYRAMRFIFNELNIWTFGGWKYLNGFFYLFIFINMSETGLGRNVASLFMC